MSELETIPTMSATERYIQIAQREDPDKWERAYALRDAVHEHMPERATSDVGLDGVNSGLYAAIAEVYAEAQEAGLADVEVLMLSRDYNTVMAWPEETRVEGATYSAHMELRSLKNRQGRLSKWVAQTTDGYIGQKAARRKKSELGKPASERVEEARPQVRFSKNVERAVKRWSGAIGLTRPERRDAISVLRDLINRLEEGEWDADSAE